MLKKLKKLNLDKLDRILFLLLVLLHVAVIFEFFLHKLEHILPETVIAIIYIVIITAFWSYIILKKSAEEIEKSTQSNSDLQRQIIEYDESLKMLGKYEKYAYAYKSIALAFSEIHSLQRFIKTADPKNPNVADTYEVMIEHFGRFCDHVVTAYEDITGKRNISVCIKVIHGNESKTSEISNVKTLVRDVKNYAERDKDSGTMHPIKDNSAYITVLKNIKKTENERCFFENNLPLLLNYKNTSKQIYGQIEYPNEMTNQERIENWKLPYKSTVVTGILPSKPEYKKMNHLIGYICIDSNDCGAFDKVFDSKIFNGIADGIYNVMKDFKAFSKLITNPKK